MKNLTPLKVLRKREKVTLEQLARKVGTDSGNLSRIERGIQTPGKELATAIVEFFDNEITELEIFYPFRSNKHQKVS